MEEQNIEMPDVPEATVQFKQISDLRTLRIDNPEINETLVEISGYDLNVDFNMKYLKSVEEVEAACNGIAQLFGQLIMEKLLESNKPD